MKELARFTLNAGQVKEACEAYVQRRIDPGCEEAVAQGAAAVTIVVTRKPSPRKPRDATKPALLIPLAGDGPTGSGGGSSQG